MEFSYYYGSQADQFSFIRIPKIMLTEETFSSLSIPAKVLYGVLLDRMTLSQKNASDHRNIDRRIAEGHSDRERIGKNREILAVNQQLSEFQRGGSGVENDAVVIFN